MPYHDLQLNGIPGEKVLIAKPETLNQMSEGRVYETSTVHVADHFTNEVVYEALARETALLLTAEGGAACHAAVYLRHHLASQNGNLVCVAGLGPMLSTVFAECEGVKVEGDGRTTFLGVTRPEKQAESTATICEGQWQRRKASDVEICYWPHRRLNRVEYELRRNGLCRSLAKLGAANAECRQAEDGTLWFRGGIPVCTLRARMREPIEAAAHFDSLMRDYDEIVTRLHGLDSYPYVSNNGESKHDSEVALDELVNLIDKYYGCFFVLHDTYYQIFERAFRLGKILGSAGVEELQSKVLAGSPTVLEFVQRGEFPAVRKGIHPHEPVTSIPSITLREEVEGARQTVGNWTSQAVESFVDRAGSGDMAKRLVEYAAYAASVLCAKERKFLLNKCLYTRLACVITRLAPSEVSDGWLSATQQQNEYAAIICDSRLRQGLAS